MRFIQTHSMGSDCTAPYDIVDEKLTKRIETHQRGLPEVIANEYVNTKSENAGQIVRGSSRLWTSSTSSLARASSVRSISNNPLKRIRNG